MTVNVSRKKRIIFGIKNLTQDSINRLFVPKKAEKKAEKMATKEPDDDGPDENHLEALQIDEDTTGSRDDMEQPTIEQVRNG